MNHFKVMIKQLIDWCMKKKVDMVLIEVPECVGFRLFFDSLSVLVAWDAFKCPSLPIVVSVIDEVGNVLLHNRFAQEQMEAVMFLVSCMYNTGTKELLERNKITV